MALIKCPECGKEVSDKAQTCIHCGCPLGKPNYTATFRMPHMEGVLVKKKIVLTNKATGKLLAEAGLDEVVKFEVAEPMTIHFEMKGGFHADFPVEPQNNAKYAIVIRKSFLGTFQQPTLSQVDVIDSDY